jgi:hypothetical protein
VEEALTFHLHLSWSWRVHLHGALSVGRQSKINL